MPNAPESDKANRPPLWKRPWAIATSLVLGIALVFLCLGFVHSHRLGELSGWFAGTWSAIAATIALYVSVKAARDREEEKADQRAALARAVTTETRSYWQPIQVDCKHLAGVTLVLIVDVTNQGTEPILGVQLESVHASGHYTYGRILLGARPDPSQIPEGVGDLSDCLSPTDVRSVLGPRQTIRFVGTFERTDDVFIADAHGEPLRTLGEGDEEHISAVITFADGHGLRWRRWAMQPPERLTREIPTRQPPGGYVGN